MRRLVAASWIGVGLCIAATFVAWRTGSPAWSPAAWVVVAAVVVIVPLLLAAFFSARRFLLRRPAGPQPSRLGGLGWLLVAATPVTWVACYYAHVYVLAICRESLLFDTSLRLAAVATLPYLDLEARVRYRRTEGRHVTLYDDRAVEDPEALTLEMDQHLTGMARLLGQGVPPGRVTWVRGPLIGTTGRAIVSTCICDDRGGSSKLTPLDRHESAHSLITLLAGPDQDPPALLMEGWAEHQSADRDRLIVDLESRRRDAEAYSLQELVEPPWYGSSAGPVYWVGGPFVHYVIGRFGPMKFYELYSQTRRATFKEDAAAILGESWGKTEEGFWRWVEVEALLIDGAEPPADPTPAAAIELAEGVDPDAWRELLGAVREAHSGVKTLPEGAYRVVSTTEATGEYASERDDHQTLEVVATDNGTWMIRSRDGATLYTADTPTDVAYLCRAEGVTRGSVNDFAARRDARREAQDVHRFYLSRPPSFPWRTDSREAVGWRLEELKRPKPGGDAPWVVELTCRRADQPDDPPHRVRCEVSPRYGWSEVRASGGRGGTASWESETRYEPIGESYLPVGVAISSSDEKGTYRYGARLTVLGPADRKRVRAEVERAIRAGTTLEYLAVRRTVRAAAVGVPLAALAFLTAGRRMARREDERP